MTNRFTVLAQMALLACACATPGDPVVKVDHIGLMIVMVRSHDLSAPEVDESAEITSCISERLNDRATAVRQVNFDRFHQSLFADLPTASVPAHPDFFESLAASPEFASVRDELGLDYVLFVGGVRQPSFETEGGCIAGAAGNMGAGACLVFSDWDHRTQLAAILMDVHSGQREQLDAEATSHGGAGIALWFPYVFPPGDSLPSACRKLGDQIADQLSHEGRAP